MDANQLVTVITGILEGGGLAVFIFYLVRGLKSKISALEGTIAAQKQTLDVMDKRISETEKIGEIYRKLISDLPGDIDNYRKVVSSTKDEMIQELQKANQLKDGQLKESAQLKLKEIELVEQSLSAIPRLQQELGKTINELQTRLKSIEMLMDPAAGSSAFLTHTLWSWSKPRADYSALFQYLDILAKISGTKLSEPKKPPAERDPDEDSQSKKE